MGLGNFLEYVEKDTWMHKVDPNIKMIYTLLVIFMAFVLWDFFSLTILFVLQLFLLASIRPPKTKIAFYVKVFGYVSIATILSQGLFYYAYYIRGEGTVIFYVLPPSLPVIGLITGGRGLAFIIEGFTYGVLVSEKMLIMIIASLLLIYTTMPGAIMKGLIRIGIPTKLVISMMTALRFLPIIMQEALEITTIMRLKREKFSLFRIHRVLYIMIKSIIIESYKRALIMGLALKIRGINNKPKIYFKEGEISLFWSIVLLCLIIFLVFLQLVGFNLLEKALFLF